MPILPFFLLIILITIFFYGIVDTGILILIIGLALSTMLFLLTLMKNGLPKLSWRFSVKKSLTSEEEYSASAVFLSTHSCTSEKDWAGGKTGYERLSNFSETLASLGVPAAYISFFYPPTFISGKASISRTFLMVWVHGKDRERLKKLSATYLDQLEGICEIAFPGVNARRMEEDELSHLLNHPIPVALTKLIKPVDHLRAPVSSAPLLPPPKSNDPSDYFPAPDPDTIAGDGPLLGMVFSNGKKIAPLVLYLKDLQRHVSIFGSTGSGKSTTAISLALRLSSIGISVLIMDWHGEHTAVVKAAGGKVYSPGSADNGLTINPMYCPKMSDVDFQVEFVTDIFSQIFQFTPPQAYMFREALRSSYKARNNPTVSDLIKELSLLPIRSSWDHETRMALMRRLKLFTEGKCGMAVDGKDNFFREEIFKGLVDIDLSNLKDVNSRSIFSNFILKAVYDNAVSNRSDENLRHVLIIEEAHNIIPPRRPESPRTVGERILSELRKFGEGVIVVTQFPSSISQEVIKNTSIRIIHTIRSGEDLVVLRESMSLDDRQREALTLLSTGEAVVNLPYRSSDLLVKVAPDPLLSDVAPPRSRVGSSLLSGGDEIEVDVLERLHRA
ncbi:MAG: ATP-binding protein [Candidatus Methanomethylicaceae archaeon]